MSKLSFSSQNDQGLLEYKITLPLFPVGSHKKLKCLDFLSDTGKTFSANKAIFSLMQD